MGKVLVIAEKPSVGNDIAKALGGGTKANGYIENDNYIFTWAVGHLIGLKYPEEHNPAYATWNLSDLPFAFPLSESLKVLPDTASQFQVIKKLIARTDVDYIVNAGDAGREGLLIQEWIYRMAGNRKPIKMLWISSFTEAAVRDAFNGHLKNRADFMGLLEEAEARAEGDQILGINYSRLLTLTKAAPGTSLSYGRCQTPLLNIIVNREMEIAGFKPEPYYNIEITYEKGFKGILVDQDKKKIDIKSKDEAQQILNRIINQGRVISYITEEKSKKPPLLYNLAALQKTMGSRYGYTPDQTLQIAQALYEKHKILSYPRTDSQCLSTDLYDEITDHIMSCNFGPFAEYIARLDLDHIKADKRYFNDLKVTDHHALIPTINAATAQIYQTLNQEEKNVFDAVVCSFISIFYPDYQYSASELLVENAGCCFLSRGTTIRSLGYKEVLKMEPGETDKDDKDDQKQIIPSLAERDLITLDSKQILDKMTKPPARYTVSSLIAVMEKYNIGTSATRAEIIKKLQNPKRPFVRMEKNKYYATSLGRDFISVVPEELKDTGLTERFELQLSQIEEGKLTKDQFLKDLLDDLKGNIEKFSKESSEGSGSEQIRQSRPVIGKCPKCGKDVITGSKGYGCSGYKEGCDFVIWKTMCGKSIPEMVAKQLLMKGRTSKIKGFKSKNGKAFEAALVLKADKTVGFMFDK